jgi:hypothetical protein
MPGASIAASLKVGWIAEQSPANTVKDIMLIVGGKLVGIP